MKVSIITISFNSADTIEDTIQSVLSQSYRDIEYIIVDGASKDDTMNAVNQHLDEISKVISEKDRGIYDAMNKGVQLATGDIVGILNSDDFYADENVVSDVVKKFSETGCDGLYADLVYVDREKSDKIIRTWKAGEYKPGKFKRGWMPPHPTFFVKKKCYDEFGLYNIKLKSAADYELMLRFIHKHKIEVSYLPRVITKMRTGGQSNITLKNRLKANMEDRLAWKMNGLKPGFFTLTWKPISKIFQFLKPQTPH
ncbi:MAG: glycosyltransferase family 2 protein [Flavobacteriales bacterium]|nr:glycosyltransferase family 2 protein [Flavobacteriales bacterium]